MAEKGVEEQVLAMERLPNDDKRYCYFFLHNHHLHTQIPISQFQKLEFIFTYK